MEIVKIAKEKLIHFNIFLDIKTFQEQNHMKIRDQVLATRLYLHLFSVSLIVLVFYSSLTTKMISVTVFDPSLDTYDRLYTAYSNTLSCSCRTVTAAFATFMSMEYVQHPVRFLV